MENSREYIQPEFFFFMWECTYFFEGFQVIKMLLVGNKSTLCCNFAIVVFLCNGNGGLVQGWVESEITNPGCDVIINRFGIWYIAILCVKLIQVELGHYVYYSNGQIKLTTYERECGSLYPWWYTIWIRGSFLSLNLMRW